MARSATPRSPDTASPAKDAEATAASPGERSPKHADGGAQELDPRIGQRYGKYQITRLIGTGGMATVYEAADTLLNRNVAIKFLPDARKQQSIAVERFINEAQVAGRLNHPHIISIYDIGYEHDTYYIAMELLKPGSAGGFLKKRGRMHWIEATVIVMQCCQALAAAHQAGLVHRDIKPDNILCSPTGTVKLADFGLVKELMVDGTAGLTQSGVVVGTPLYMSPEQCSAQPLDARSDLYSLGASFYALLTGSAPYPTGSVPHIMLAHCKAPIPDPRVLAPDLPEAIVRVVQHAMAKRPHERYQQAEDMRAALEVTLEGLERPPFDFLIPGTVGSPPQRARGSLKQSIGNRRSDSSIPPTAAGSNRSPGSLRSLPSDSGQGADLRGQTPASGTNPAAGSITLSRRAVIGGSVGLIAAAAATTWLFKWRNGGGNGGDRPQVPDAGVRTQPMVAPTQKPTGEPIKVGVINSLSGTLAISARPVVDATLLAIEQINARGGVLGRPIAPIVVDCKSDNNLFTREAERLLVEHKVLTLFGGWSPSNRRSIRPIVEKYKHLLMYPTRDEGLEDSNHIIYGGSVPNQLVLPALRWCLNKLNAERIFIVGTDGLFSHMAAEVTRDELRGNKRARVVDERYALLGEKSFRQVIQSIRDTKPDVVLNCMIGDSNLEFFKEMRAVGIKPKDLPTISFSVGETELSLLADVDMTGDYLAASYFQSDPRPQNQAFLSAFRNKYGQYHVTGAAMEAAYAGVHLWAQAVEAAGVAEVGPVKEALMRQSYDAPGGTVRIDSATHHTWKPFRIGQIRADQSIAIVERIDEPIPPEPFPRSRTRAEWEALVDHWYAQWDQHWVNPQKPNPLK